MSSPDPREVLRRWVDGVNGGEVDAVAGLYDAGGTLLATFSPDVLREQSQIKGYFQMLADRGGLRVTLDEDSVVVQALDGGCCVLTGRYVFQVGAGGAASSCPARFTFVVDASKERPILHHHSSEIPAGAS